VLDRRMAHVIAVARTGSFTAAAQAVGVSQSAVTKSVADLEKQIGYPLFHRVSRGALPTEQGREFIERAVRLFDDARDLLQGSAIKTDRYAGVLRIGVCPSSLEWLLIDPLAKLLDRHPSILLDVSGSSFERMVQQLRNGSVDVAVGFEAAFCEWPDLRREQIPTLHSTLFVRREHPILKGLATLADLANYEFISPSDSRPYGTAIRGLFEDQGIDWRTRIHIVDYFPIVRRIVAESNAIGVVALQYAHSPSFDKAFSVLELPRTFPPAPLCCAVRARWEPKPAVKAFITQMRNSSPPRS
jgi:DNA-binding transcriptional LysR family regulator